MSSQPFVNESTASKILTYDWVGYQQRVAASRTIPVASPHYLRKLTVVVLIAVQIGFLLHIYSLGDIVVFATVGALVSILIGFLLGTLKR